MAAVIAVCGSCSRQYVCKKVITPIDQIITTTFFFFKHFTMSKPGSSKKSNNAATNEKEIIKGLRHELCVPGK